MTRALESYGKEHRENAQDDKNEPKEAKKWAEARGESNLTLQDSPSGRNLNDDRT
jgi:hypothetical protein